MAEYIDRTLLELDTEWSEYYDDFTSYSQSQIKDMPQADVIERSKIDKAIEELQHIKVYGHTATARLVSLPEVLDVLKRI